MKKIVTLIILSALGIIYIAAKDPKSIEAYTDVASFARVACSQAVTVSTTPAAMATCLTSNRQEVRIRQLGPDVVYVNYTLPASSSAAAATGIKVFQTAANNTYLSLPLSRDQSIYLTFAGNSGTSSIRDEEFGHY